MYEAGESARKKKPPLTGVRAPKYELRESDRLGAREGYTRTHHGGSDSDDGVCAYAFGFLRTSSFPSAQVSRLARKAF